MEASSAAEGIHQEEERLGSYEEGLKDPERKELRLVLLGAVGSGKSSVVDAVLGVETSCTEPSLIDCQKRYRELAARRVAVVDTPERLCVERPLQDVRRQFSLCAALSAPGPHAFLLSVPVHRPIDLELQILETIEKVFGPDAVHKHGMVVFTRMERLPADIPLDDFLSTQRVDLLEVVQKCGDRFHPLRPEEEGDLEELLVKVEKMVEESEREFYSCPLLLEAERQVKVREQQMKTEGVEDTRAQAERLVDDLMVEGISDLCVSIPESSFFRWLWNGVLSWLLWIPKMVRGSTLLGSIVGLFVGGSFGGAMGATVGSVATEVERRKKK